MHLIIMDSRGKGLGDIIRSKITDNVIMDILVRDGASLAELTDAASNHLKGHPFDVVYIAGGACNITDKDQVSKIISYQWGTGQDLQDHLLKELNSANAHIRKYFPASKVVFCPLIASELRRIVTSIPTSPEDQLAVEEAVWAFNQRAFEINKENEAFAPALHHPVHRFCKGRRRAYYHHLGDGIHPSKDLKLKWAGEFIKSFAHN